MDREILRACGVDYDEGVERCAGNTALFERLLEKYASNDQRLAALKDAMARLDYTALLSAAHELKGVSGNLSIKPLYESAAVVVTLLREERYDSLPEAVASLEQIQIESTRRILAAAGR